MTRCERKLIFAVIATISRASQRIERIIDRRSGNFRRVAVAPRFWKKTPSDFVRRRKLRLKRNVLQCNHTRERKTVFHLRDEPAEAVVL